MKYKLGVNVKIKIASINDLETIIQFQTDIIYRMKNKDFFCPLTEEEFLSSINGIGNTYMLFFLDKLIGLFVLNACPSVDIISQYHLSDPIGVGIFDSVMIKEEYRGCGLQIQCIDYLNKEAKKYDLREVVATVHPDNIYSLNNFLKMNYKIVNKIYIHNGPRYILSFKFN